MPARIRYCNEWEKELDLGNPVCGLALINLIRKGEWRRAGERRRQEAAELFSLK